MRQDRLCALFLNERHSRISIQRPCWEGHSYAKITDEVKLWKSTVEPGKTFEPKVTYHYFARH